MRNPSYNQYANNVNHNFYYNYNNNSVNSDYIIGNTNRQNLMQLNQVNSSGAKINNPHFEYGYSSFNAPINQNSYSILDCDNVNLIFLYSKLVLFRLLYVSLSLSFYSSK